MAANHVVMETTGAILGTGKDVGTRRKERKVESLGTSAEQCSCNPIRKGDPQDCTITHRGILHYFGGGSFLGEKIKHMALRCRHPRSMLASPSEIPVGLVKMPAAARKAAT